MADAVEEDACVFMHGFELAFEVVALVEREEVGGIDSGSGFEDAVLEVGELDFHAVDMGGGGFVGFLEHGFGRPGAVAVGVLDEVALGAGRGGIDSSAKLLLGIGFCHGHCEDGLGAGVRNEDGIGCVDA